ncbi:phage antirepressor KilAC domain-containing protein [Spirosoma sp. KCTC 42546]|uniref:phage antirepressor KilAC domain-containing protein n=1 Tax=Spirosoma sp. KCTC 42546 TaxID=2520506 RepID=UPI00143CD61B|nr:phage antirepressor KilAC domain-containing protein [Spirosoma sp. KCTC 42546]
MAEQEAKIIELAPKAEFYDRVASSPDLLTIEEAAKVLNYPRIGRNNLFKLLRDGRILTKGNVPYQQYIDNGYFKVVKHVYKDNEGVEYIELQTMVTPKGVQRIVPVLAY